MAEISSTTITGPGTAALHSPRVLVASRQILANRGRAARFKVAGLPFPRRRSVPLGRPAGVTGSVNLWIPTRRDQR
jgi:hypothetical protein